MANHFASPRFEPLPLSSVRLYTILYESDIEINLPICICILFLNDASITSRSQVLPSLLLTRF